MVLDEKLIDKYSKALFAKKKALNEISLSEDSIITQATVYISDMSLNVLRYGDPNLSKLWLNTLEYLSGKISLSDTQDEIYKRLEGIVNDEKPKVKTKSKSKQGSKKDPMFLTMAEAREVLKETDRKAGKKLITDSGYTFRIDYQIQQDNLPFRKTNFIKHKSKHRPNKRTTIRKNKTSRSRKNPLYHRHRKQRRRK